MHRNSAILIGVIALALFSLTAIAGEDLTDMRKPYLSSVRSADASVDAVAGWHEETTIVEGDTGTCYTAGGNYPVTRGDYCSSNVVIWDSAQRTELQHVFGFTSCPRNGTKLRFNNGFRRDNGVLVSGPAVICVKM